MTTPVEDQARQLLAQLPADRAAWPPLRWVIRADAFDCWRERLVKSGALKTTLGEAEPTLFGLPYDFGRPSRDVLIVLRIAAPACAEAAD